MEDNYNFYLIVDDHDVNLMILKRLIEKQDPNAVVVEATNGTEGYERFEELLIAGYNLTHVIVDYSMPDITGTECLKKMCDVLVERTGKTLSECDIVFNIFTANYDIKNTKICDRCDKCLNGIYYKPLTKNKLKDMIGS